MPFHKNAKRDALLMLLASLIILAAIAAIAP